MADELIVSKPEPLSDADRNRIKILEASVENGVNSALDALEEIKRDRLYRDEYPSFEEYIRGRWGKSNRYVEVFQQTYPGIAWPDFARSLSDAFASIGKANKAEAIKAAEANQRVKQKDEPVQHEPQKKAKDALRTTKVNTGVVAEQQISVILNESCGALVKKTDRPALPQTKLEETVVAS